MIVKQYKITYKQNELRPKLKIEKRINVDINEDMREDENLYPLLDKAINTKDDYVEKMYVLAMDYDYRLIGLMELSKGKHYECDIYYKELFMFLLLSGASNFMLIHNHPNNYQNFSDDDISVINEVSYRANYFDLKLVDSVIISRDNICIATEMGIM